VQENVVTRLQARQPCSKVPQGLVRCDFSSWAVGHEGRLTCGRVGNDYVGLSVDARCGCKDTWVGGGMSAGGRINVRMPSGEWRPPGTAMSWMFTERSDLDWGNFWR
jgi:hypothetical protein